jgi:hypothetical protein
MIGFHREKGLRFYKPRRGQCGSLGIQTHGMNKTNKKLPWLVGYQNSTSIQGSPSALAARYGYNGTIKLCSRCPNRMRFEFLQSENISESEQRILEEKLVSMCREWTPPLMAAPHDYYSSPKLWPIQMETNRVMDIHKIGMNLTGHSKSKQLARALIQDQNLWTEITQKAKAERTPKERSKNNISSIRWKQKIRKELKEINNRGKIFTMR